MSDVQVPAMLWELARLVGALLVLLGFISVSALILVYAERKIAAFMQDRVGPLHVGKWGLLQSIADAMKLLAKEDFVPPQGDRWMFLLAPMAFLAPVVASFALIPFSPLLTAADINVALVFIPALGSVGVIGIITAGWSSNNKYSLLGAFRAAAQIVSYEIPMILALVSGVMLAGSLSMSAVARAQESYWLVLVQPLGFAIYFVCALAETNRNPFDLPEAESEIVAGYLTEYSGIRWAMFFLGEYGNMIIVSAIATTLFLGGWQGPILPGAIWFLGKMYFLLFVFIWIRSTLPRLRADQLMELCWKGLIPLALFNVALTALIVLALPGTYLLPLATVNWLLTAALVLIGPRIASRAVGFSPSARRAMGPAYGKAYSPAGLPLGRSQARTRTVADRSGGGGC